MNARLKKYYKWRIKTILKRKLGLMDRVLNIITPSHSYHRRSEILHRALDSVLKQRPHNLKVHHIIVFDGEAPKDLKIEGPDWYTYEIVETPRTAIYGAHQRNVGLQTCKRGWVMFLDDDNVINEDCLAKIGPELKADIGVLVFQVWHVEQKKNIPSDLKSVPKYNDIDSLSFVINFDVANFATWQPLYHHDFMYVQNIWAMSAHYGYRNEVRELVIGTHL